MTAVSERRAAEVEGRWDVRYHSLERAGGVEGPKRGIDGSRRRFCLGDVGADLSEVSRRFLADNRQVWVFYHRTRRRKGLK